MKIQKNTFFSNKIFFSNNNCRQQNTAGVCALHPPPRLRWPRLSIPMLLPPASPVCVTRPTLQRGPSTHNCRLTNSHARAFFVLTTPTFFFFSTNNCCQPCSTRVHQPLAPVYFSLHPLGIDSMVMMKPSFHRLQVLPQEVYL